MPDESEQGREKPPQHLMLVAMRERGVTLGEVAKALGYAEGHLRNTLGGQRRTGWDLAEKASAFSKDTLRVDIPASYFMNFRAERQKWRAAKLKKKRGSAAGARA